MHNIILDCMLYIDKIQNIEKFVCVTGGREANVRFYNHNALFASQKTLNNKTSFKRNLCVIAVE